MARKLATKSSLSSGLGGCEGCDGVWPTKTNWSNEQSNEEHSTSTRQMHQACTAIDLELEDSATLWSVLTKVGIHFSRNEPPGSLAHRLQPLLMAMGIWELRWCTLVLSISDVANMTCFIPPCSISDSWNLKKNATELSIAASPSSTLFNSSCIIGPAPDSFKLLNLVEFLVVYSSPLSYNVQSPNTLWCCNDVQQSSSVLQFWALTPKREAIPLCPLLERSAFSSCDALCSQVEWTWSHFRDMKLGTNGASGISHDCKKGNWLKLCKREKLWDAKVHRHPFWAKAEEVCSFRGFWGFFCILDSRCLEYWGHCVHIDTLG